MITPSEIHEGLLDLMRQGRVRAYLDKYGRVLFVAVVHWTAVMEQTEVSIDDVERLYSSGELE